MIRILLIILSLILAACVTTPSPKPEPCSAVKVVRYETRESGRRIVYNKNAIRKTPAVAAALRAGLAKELKAGALNFQELENINGYVYTPAPGIKMSLLNEALKGGWVDEPELIISVRQTVCQKCTAIPCPTDPVDPTDPEEPNPTPIFTDRVPYGIAMVRGVEAQKLVGRAAQSAQCVAVLDTGVNAAHPDLAGRLIPGRSFVGGDTTDRMGHGTHVMGTVLAAANNAGIIGVGGDIKGQPIKVLGDNGSGSDTGIAAGIIYAADSGCKTMNMSLGSSSRSGPIDSAIAYAISKGVTVVVAAGNSGSPMSGSPSLTPGVIAITAVDQNGRPANFTSYGPSAKFHGPGVNTESLSHQGSAFAIMSGTSMAAPHCAGVVALMKSAGKTVIKGRNLGLGSQYGSGGLCDALASVQ